MNQETKLTEKQQKKVTELLNKVGIKKGEENPKFTRAQRLFIIQDAINIVTNK